MQDIFLDIETFDEENMLYMKPLLFYTVARNMAIYYKKNQASKQKIIIKTPKMMVPFGITEKDFDGNGKKVRSICLSFNTMTNLYNEEDIKKFYYFIEKIDKVNEEIINDHKKSWGLPSKMTYRRTLNRSSKDWPHLMNIGLPCDESMGNLFSVYDENAIKSDIKIIQKRSIVSLVLELTDLRFGDNDFRAHFTIMQIRKFRPYSPIQEFFMSACFIGDDDDPNDKVYSDIISKYQLTIQAAKQTTLSRPTTSVSASAPPAPPIKPKSQQEVIRFRPPSLSELLSAKAGLKAAIESPKTDAETGSVQTDVIEISEVKADATKIDTSVVKADATKADASVVKADDTNTIKTDDTKILKDNTKSTNMKKSKSVDTEKSKSSDTKKSKSKSASVESVDKSAEESDNKPKKVKIKPKTESVDESRHKLILDLKKSKKMKSHKTSQ